MQCVGSYSPIRDWLLWKSLESLVLSLIQSPLKLILHLPDLFVLHVTPMTKFPGQWGVTFVTLSLKFLRDQVLLLSSFLLHTGWNMYVLIMAGIPNVNSFWIMRQLWEWKWHMIELPDKRFLGLWYWTVTNSALTAYGWNFTWERISILFSNCYLGGFIIPSCT